MDRQVKTKNLSLFALISVIAFALLIGAVVLVDSFSHLDIPEEPHDRKTLVIDGVSYFPRQDIRVFLFMGIDREGPVADSGSYKNEGAADVILTLIFDETHKEYTILALNRDSMVTMPVLGLGGKIAGSKIAQLALSHTYGNGLRQSCVNTRSTVSDLLYGITIHQYISMNMDAISILTDAVGGVKVNITDDFSLIDSSLVKGEMLLNGEQAYKFIRNRKDVGDQLNLSRMERHNEFLKGFIDAYQTNVGNNVSYAMEVFNELSPYIVTDCSDQTLMNLLSRFYEYEFVEILSPAGANVRGKEFMEFYIDEENLQQIILSLLFEPKA